jgi:GTP cyclohydrolase IA
LVRDITFHSLCEHHLIPFFGVAHVAYIPSKHGKITGLSKVVRLVRTAAARLQLQERLTSTIADTLVKSLEPEGVLVLIKAEHLCMSMRGVRAPGSRVVTSAVRGVFRTNAATRAEVLALIEAPNA